MNILAFESSCDETSAAVVRDGREVLSDIIASQVDIHAKFGGVVPEIASRAHTEAISGITAQALEQAGMTLDDIDAFAVTYAPGLIGALLTGVSFAKGLAYSCGKPLVPVHHIKGHVAANYIAHADLQPPFYALVVSGGHTSLFRVNTFTKYDVIGVTRDDAAGEAFDKAARVLGLPYPGGAAMDKLAHIGDKNAVKFSVSHVNDNKYDFSFSGLKTSVINYAHTLIMRGEPLTDKNKADIAASFTQAAVKTVTTRIESLFQEYNRMPLVLAGGVAANSHLRAALTDLTADYGVKLFLPPLSLCGDNAAMIGSQAYFEYQKGTRAQLDLNAFACLEVDV